MTTPRPVRTTIRRPGAGVTIDPARLLRMREIRLLSRAQLAAKMCGDGYSITPDAIAKIENGYRRPKTATLSRLCDALNCEPEDLLPLPGLPGPSGPVPCPDCSARYGHDSGCPKAT